VEDEVDRLVDLDVLHHVRVDEGEAVVAHVLQVLEGGCLEIVETDDAVPVREQVLAEVRAEESGSAGDHRRWHEAKMVSACPAASRFLTKALRAT
jgi:hypothetical protein